MGLIDQAKKDIEQITSNLSDFGVQLTLTAPGSEIASVIGIHAKHHTGFDAEGFPVNSKIASVAISEQFLLDQGYPTRINGEVNLKKHIVKAKDSTGIEQIYVIREFFPDETIGLIVCILGDYE
ncbi:MAG: hypothetical protein JKY43_10980 [Phycisphaerales bacterium]|nr:hypothetical protein [Phycisphaerales bacterium]